MSQQSSISRRAFIASASVAATFMTMRGVAQTPAALTSESPLGPFYPVGYAGDDDYDLTLLKGSRTRAMGEVIEVAGRVLNRHGNPVNGATIKPKFYDSPIDFRISTCLTSIQAVQARTKKVPMRSSCRTSAPTILRKWRCRRNSATPPTI